MASTKLSLKLLVNKKTNKVLFAEAGKDFVDFLFSLLSLPLGTVIKLIKAETIDGCVGNLYESVVNLNEAFLQPNQSKNLLLNPPVPSHATDMPLLLHTTQTHSTNSPFMSIPSFSVTPTSNSTGRGGFVKGSVMYVVTDDLSVSPMSMISVVAQLNMFNIQDFGALEEKVVEFGIDEGVELLTASLQSKAALTTVLLAKKEVKVDNVGSSGD